MARLWIRNRQKHELQSTRSSHFTECCCAVWRALYLLLCIFHGSRAHELIFAIVLLRVLLSLNDWEAIIASSLLLVVDFSSRRTRR
jgi:hypothetical protein